VHPIELTDRYYAAVRARDIDAFMALFAEDAIFVRPDGIELLGAAAIRQMELGVFAASPPTPTPVATVAGENAVAVEIRVRLTDGTIYRAASFFQLNDEGRIQRLSVYRQAG
jgi:uncharacterized protein (TIGR02246 family)